MSKKEVDDPRQAAIQRLTSRREFKRHLVVYVIVNAFLVAIWSVASGGYFWPVWPIAGWGIGLAVHGWIVYGERPITEEEIQREMEKRHGGPSPGSDASSQR